MHIGLLAKYVRPSNNRKTMGSQEFFVLYIIISVFFALWYFSSRKKSHREPTQLNLKAPDSGPIVLPDTASNLADELRVNKDYYKDRYATDGIPKAPRRSSSAEAPREITIVFNYNGHDWDAYEVLGVPAGSSLPEVTAAYQSAIKTAEKNTLPFLETAFKAILNKKHF